MRDVFSLAKQTSINPAEPYLRTYPHLITYFAGLQTIAPSDVVRGAHMAYGWMPTILEMHWGQGDEELVAAASSLAKARSGQDISLLELNQLASIVNNSMVGASKLLHFAAPSHYPIWDSRVYRYLYKEAPYHYRLKDAAKFSEYVSKVRSLTADPRMPGLLEAIKSKLGYAVTPIRAIELVMFVHGSNDGA